MTTVSDIRDYIDCIAPYNLAFDRDNVGLIVGCENKAVRSVLLTLDVDEKVADEAGRLGVDLIISHHPLMFNAIRRLTDNTPAERTLRKLLKKDVALISAHTNLDCVRGGLNDYLCEKLEIENTDVIEIVGVTEGICHGFGRIGEVKDEIPLSSMLKRCSERLGAKGLRYTGDEEKMIKKVAVNCGGGADILDECIRLGADLFITGDVKYNPFRDAYESNMAVIDAGHYETEHIVVELFKKIIADKFTDIEIFVSSENVAPIKFYVRGE